MPTPFGDIVPVLPRNGMGNHYRVARDQDYPETEAADNGHKADNPPKRQAYITESVERLRTVHIGGSGL